MKRTISGIRGIVGEDLGPRDVMEYCGGFAGLAEGPCVMARDTRPSSALLKEAAAASLMRYGTDVLDLGVSPTPVAFYEARRHGAGLVVTSSHNPLEWNGLKFILEGRGIDEAELDTITAGPSGNASSVGHERDITSDYVARARQVVGPVEDPPDVVVDAGGGAAAAVAPGLLRSLGCNVDVINEEPGCSRGPDPTAGGLGGLVSACDGRPGFAFDLDGDRMVVVMDGAPQAPDATLALGVARALGLGCKKFVLSVDTSLAVERLILGRGGEVHRSKVGEANVVGMMLKTGAEAGGEGSSAGFILPSFNMCRDGILASGLVSSMVGTGEAGKVLEYMKGYVQIRDAVRLGRGAEMGRILDEMSGRFGRVDTLDGIRAEDGENSWVLVRESNTEHAVRISVESDTIQDAERLMSEARKMVEPHG